MPAVVLGDNRAAGQVVGGEQAGGAVADVIVSHPGRGRRQDRQARSGAVQGLDLRLRAPRGAVLPGGGERTPPLVCRSRPAKLRAA
jgi:hypothetical protein